VLLASLPSFLGFAGLEKFPGDRCNRRHGSYPEFPFSSSTDTRRSAIGRFKPGFECTALASAPGEAGVASGGHATSGKCYFSNQILRHLLLPVCGELVILTEDRAAAQTCGTMGEG
jgi:hypothetical protein